MKITIFQFDLLWLDKKANLLKIRNCIENNLTSDLLVLPEMFNTAYIMNPNKGAEDLKNSGTVEEIKSMLQNTSLVVAGSIPTFIDNQFYNSFIFISNEGLQFQYDKVHLFKMAGEGKAYTSGIDSNLFEFNGFKIRPMVCYDLRFPYLSFQRKDQYHDLLIYAANWPIRRIDHWRTLLQSRAIENQCFVIGVNRVGSDQNLLEYNGNSLAIDFSGHVIADLENKEGFMNIEIDLKDQTDYRVKLPFLKDSIL